jgi:hypothetical protein
MVRVTDEGRALDLVTGDPELDSRLREALFLPTTTQLALSENTESALEFEYAAGDLKVLKAFRFQADGYVVRVSVSVQKAGQEIPKTIIWGPGVGNPTEAEKEVYGYREPQAVLMTAGGLERLDADAIEETRPLRAVRWAGVAAMYFTALWLPAEGPAEAEITTVSVPRLEGEDEPQRLPVVGLVLGLSTEPVELYVGPKDYPVVDTDVPVPNQLSGLGSGAAGAGGSAALRAAPADRPGAPTAASGRAGAHHLEEGVLGRDGGGRHGSAVVAVPAGHERAATTVAHRALRRRARGREPVESADHA